MRIAALRGDGSASRGHDPPAAGTRRVLTLPNLLTASRLPLAIALWLELGHLVWFLAILGLAGATDVADGWLARKARRRARGEAAGEARGPGVWLDPLCDKIFVLSALGALVVGFRPDPLLVALVATREIALVGVASVLVVPGVRRRSRMDSRASVLGKATTVAQFAAVTALALDASLAIPVVALAAALGLAATAHYAARAARGARG